MSNPYTAFPSTLSRRTVLSLGLNNIDILSQRIILHNLHAFLLQLL